MKSALTLITLFLLSIPGFAIAEGFLYLLGKITSAQYQTVDPLEAKLANE